MNKNIETNGTTRHTDDRREIFRALVGAGLLLAAALALAFARSRGFMSETLSERLFGVLIGLILVVTGNAIPKKRDRHAEPNCPPSRIQRFQRFAGWTFVLGGLGYVISWVVLPLPYAGTVAMGFVAVAVLLVAPRMLWCFWRRQPSRPAQP